MTATCSLLVDVWDWSGDGLGYRAIGEVCSHVCRLMHPDEDVRAQNIRVLVYDRSYCSDVLTT